MHLEVTHIDRPHYHLRIACSFSRSKCFSTKNSRESFSSGVVLSPHPMLFCFCAVGTLWWFQRPRGLPWASGGSPSTLPLWSQIWTYYYLFYFRLTFKIRIHLRSQARAESYPVETVTVQDIFIIKETKVSSHIEYFLTKEILMSPPPRPTSPSSHASPYLPPRREDRTKLFNVTFFG